MISTRRARTVPDAAALDRADALALERAQATLEHLVNDIGRGGVGDVVTLVTKLDKLRTTLAHHAPPSSSWGRDLATALADVRIKLGDATSGRDSTAHEPLFGGGDAVDVLPEEFSDASWLVKGLITRGGVTVIGGEPKVSKTWIATELALAVATGTKACGEFFAERGRVAYFYAEDMRRQVRNRLRALLSGSDRMLGRGTLHVRPRGAFLDLLRDEDLALVVASARQLGQLDLLVLDPLRDIHSGEEDKSDSMRDVMRRLRVLAELLRCTVAVVHHANKGGAGRGGRGLRGSSAIHGSIDCGIYLSDTEGSPDVIANVLDTEVKGGRSAGQRKIELHISDDDNGEAIQATWRVTRETEEERAERRKARPGRESKQSAEDTIRSRIVEALQKNHEGFEGITKLREAVKGEKQLVFSVIRNELEKREGGLLAIRLGRVCLRGDA